MRPALIPIGDGAEDYQDTAMALYRSGKKGRFLVDGVAAILIGNDIKIVMLVSEFAIFQHVPVGTGFLPLFSDAVPGSFPAFTNPVLPAMATFFPIYPDELLVPAYNQLQVFVSGASAPYFTLPFAGAILSTHGEALVWLGAIMHPNRATGDFWYLLKYQLTGYLNPYENPMITKMVLSNGESNLWEYTFSAPNVLAARQLQIGGVNYRRLKGIDGDRIMVGIQDGSSYSGALYEVQEDSGGLGLAPLDLPSLPSGSRSTASPGAGWGTYTRHTDWTVDIFTSERAKHFYVINFCADNSVRHYDGDSIYPNDIRFFPGMSMSVEKRLKTDLSLVQTFGLTPSAVDRVLQGLPVAAQDANTLNSGPLILHSGTYYEADMMTRFAPWGIGAVLVDADGNEFPVLCAISCTQDLFSSNDTNRGYYASGAISFTTMDGQAGTRADIFQQAVLLWLGNPPPGFDCYDWPGVDAVGLKISEAQPGLTIGNGIGGMAQFGAGIADSDHAMLPMLPFFGSGDQSVISLRLSGGVPVARLEHTQNVSQGLFMYDI